MRFVIVDQAGRKIAVNPNQVEWVERHDDASCRVHFASGAHILVDEPIKELFGKLTA